MLTVVEKNLYTLKSSGQPFHIDFYYSFVLKSLNRNINEHLNENIKLFDSLKKLDFILPSCTYSSTQCECIRNKRLIFITSEGEKVDGCIEKRNGRMIDTNWIIITGEPRSGKTKLENEFKEKLKYRNRGIFYLSSLEEYKADYATLETEEDSRRLGQLIRDTYKDLGYDLVTVPVMDIERRVKFIFDHINT